MDRRIEPIESGAAVRITVTATDAPYEARAGPAIQGSGQKREDKCGSK